MRLVPRWLPTGGVILSFHGLTGEHFPSESGAHLSVSDFRSLVRIARRCGDIVPLRTVVKRQLEGKSTSGMIAFTSDDAYASLAFLTVEVVGEERVPLTIFVVTDAAEGGSAYWWDRVEDLYPSVPKSRWQDFETRVGVPQSFRDGQAAIHGPLRPLRQWILRHYKGRWPVELEAALGDLEREYGVRTAQRSMNFDELETFVSSGDITIGVHTRSHPVLPLLPANEVREEIQSAYGRLRERFEDVLPVLAFPFGFFDQRTPSLASEAGMIACLTLEGRGIGARDGGNAGLLPRYNVSRGGKTWKLALRLCGLVDRVGAFSAESGPRYPDLPSAVT